MFLLSVAADFKIITPALMQLRHIPRFPVALPVNLHKMEINAAYGNWKLASYVRGNQVTGETREHLSAFRITKGRREVMSIEASHKIEGRLLENIIIRNEAKGNFALILLFCLKNIYLFWKGNAVMQKNLN